MRSYKFILFLILTVSLFTLPGFGQNFTAKKAGKTIEENVRRKILRLPRYEVFDQIGFKVDGSTVTLFGKVRNAINKSDAKNSVEDIPGVTRVINNIEVLPIGRFDETIRGDLYRRLSNTGGLSRYLWHVNPEVRLIVERGHVTLEGTVANRGDYRLMNIVARGRSERL
jgi:hyperosmotically inducible protein